ncbi:MAG: ABC transporter substrate-binding protein [Actinomycetota bacterium]
MTKRSLAALLLCLALALPGAARAETDARSVVQKFDDALLASMKDGQKLGFKGRSEKLRPTLNATFDWDAMVRGTLGPTAAKLSPDELARLTAAFARFSEANWASQFDEFNDERFEVGEPKASTGDHLLVPNRIVEKSGKTTPIDYLVHQVGGQWRVVDVLMDGAISEVARRRSEFVPIVRAKGVDGLIEMLDNQSVKLGSK